jgi:hypothetical protein
LFSAETLRRIAGRATMETQAELSGLLSSMTITSFSFMKSLKANDYEVFFGVNNGQFNYILNILGPAGNKEDAAEALGMLLMYLRLENSQTVLASHFRTSQPTVSRNIAQVREAMETIFVPKYLGYSHISRER